MGVPTDLPVEEAPPLVDELRRAEGRLLATVERLGDAGLDEPSRLEGWDRRTVLAHLLDGAEAAARMTLDALAGRPTAFHPGGPAERAASLLRLRGAAAAEAVERLRRAGAELDDLWQGLGRRRWATVVEEARLGRVVLTRLLVLRLTEVEVHHGDLGAGPRTWSHRFVEVALPLRVAWLPTHHRRRPDADRGVGGRWLLDPTDGRPWLVTAGGDHARVRWAGEGEGAGATLSGPPADLLAVLLGRRSARHLTLAGDLDLARAFKRAFPGP